MPEQIKILLIEDDNVDSLSFQRSLKESGINTELIIAEDAAEGINLYNNQKFDCVFLDYMLPGINGLAVLNKLREDKSSSIVLITSHGDEKIAVEAMKAGALDYISKSLITPESLAQVIRNVMRLRNTLRQKLEVEEALKQNEKRHRIFFENSQIFLCTHDLDGNFINVNLAGAKSIGYLPNELIGTNLKNLISPSSRNLFDNYLQKIRKEKSVAGQMQIISKHGKELTWAYHNYLYEESNEMYVIGSAQDITDRLWMEKEILNAKRIEEESVKIKELISDLNYQKLELKHSEEKFKSIVENMQLGLLEVDDFDTIIRADKRFCEMTGYTKEELIEKNTLDKLFTGNRYKSKLSLQNLKKMLCEKSVYEIQMAKKNGEIIWVLVSDTPLYDINQKIIGSIGIYLDITERKNSEQELRKAKELAENSKKTKEQFLANMSHEIRTPMNAIIGMTEILEENNLSEEQKECADAIKLSANNLLSIINDILDFSKIESGKITFTPYPFRLEQVIEGIIQTLHFTVNNKSISLNYAISEKVPPIIIGDVVRLRQILLNLCSNSIKFTEQGTVRIDVQLKEHKNDDYILLFIVTDTGIGIPEEKLLNIFESFVQASGDTTRKYGGTGLGLAITKQLVELQGGTISVKSKPKEGAQFSFTISFKKGEELQLETDTNENIFTYTGLEGIRVLLAEDNPMNQILAKKILTKWNLKYDIASNGKTAIEKLSQTDYDIILMDMHMPEMDGYEAAKYIRNQTPPPKSLTPIIAITANAIIGEEEKCLAAGMNDYISKPLNKKKLYQKMLKLMGKDTTSKSKQIILETKIITASEKCIDLTYLKKIAEGSKEFMIEMINSFIADTPKTLIDMESAFVEKKWPELKVIAHTMKSSVDFMGMHNIKEIVRNIEKYAETKTNLESLPDLISKVKYTCIRAMEELENEIKDLS